MSPHDLTVLEWAISDLMRAIPGKKGHLRKGRSQIAQGEADA